MKLLLLFTILAQATVVAPTAGTGETKFHALAKPGSVAIEGKGGAPAGTLKWAEKSGKQLLSGELRFRLSALTTGISLRDSHMKDKYLEVGKFPDAVLTIVDQELPKNGEASFSGDLFLHGVRFPVSGTAKLANDGKNVQASFPLKLSDFAIPAPSFAGISVADSVNVETNFELSPATK